MFRIAAVILMTGALGVGAQRGVASAPPVDPRGTVYFRALDNPAGMPGADAGMIRWAEQAKAQARSDAVFAALSALLGGDAPALNFVQTNSGLLPPGSHFSANISASPGGPQGTVNADPLAVASLVMDNANTHNLAVNHVPHEMAHLRQLAEILASDRDSEGGAQAFADLVAQEAARRALIPYQPGNYDGAYADYVKAINAQKTRDWILAGQFGRSGSPAWP